MHNELTAPVAVVLPAKSSSCAQARRFVEEAVVAWGLPDSLGEDAALVVTELVSNGADHARGPLRLAVSRTGTGLLIEVYDRSPELPKLRPVEPDSARGRGMIIVNAFSARWGVVPSDGGKTVWAALETTD